MRTLDITKKITAFVLVTAMIFAGTLSSFAGPSLQVVNTLADNVLEYVEIPELIHTYNPTVKQNSYELSNFRNKYGNTNEKLADAYRDLADELLAAGSPDESNPAYGALMAQSIANEAQADQLMQMADSNLDDYETYRLSFEKAEKTLAQTAMTSMVSYHTAILTGKKAEMSLDLATDQLEITKLKNELGMATHAEVLSATETQIAMQKAKADAESAVTGIKKKLQVMCGWKYESEAVIAELPEPDIARIGTINYVTDTAKALESNFTLKINEQKKKNAHDDATIKNLNVSIDSNKQNIGSSVRAAYDNIISCRDALIYAQSNEEVQKKLYDAALLGNSLGTVGSLELKAQKVTYETAVIDRKIATYNLLQALNDYDMKVEGLADA